MGGVVTFPDGTFKSGELTLPSNVVLEGASDGGTTLEDDSTADNSAFIGTDEKANDQRQGVADLTISLAAGTPVPDNFIYLGGPFRDR